MTSAVDIIAPKPATRPEQAAKASSRDEDRANFADALDAETSEPEAAAPKATATKETTTKDEPATPDTNAAAQPVQPQQPQQIPAVNSPEAILAGLTQAAPTDAPTAEAGDTTPAPAIDAAARVQGAAQDAATPAAAQQSPVPSQPSAAPQAAGAPQLADAQDNATVAAQTGEIAASSNKSAAKSAAPVQTAQAAPATLAADDAAPLSAPGEERVSATVETANTSTTKSAATTNAAADPAANKAQGGAANNANAAQVAAATAAEAAPEIKSDAPLPPTTPLVDAARTTGSEIAKVAPAHTTMQNAPATTVQVYQRMVERFDGRSQRYEIRLDPAELGRVDVRIEVGADKKVHAVLAAHDSAALTDLMRGQRSLERALSDAGIDLAKDGIRFELSSDQGRNSANNFNDKDGNPRSANVWRGFNTVDVAVDAQTAAAARPWRPQRLDVVA